MRWILSLALMAGVAFAALQFVRPGLKNPPVSAELQAPAAVKAVLRNSCYSCHSNETVLPWFDKVVPAYWLVHHDVVTARAHLNFSEIGRLPPEQQRAMLFEAITQIQLGAMPLPSYLKVHPGAVVSPADLATLKAYLNPFSSLPKLDTAVTKAGDGQFQAWTSASRPALGVSPALNGLAFFPDYKNWRAISSTDRGDNHTMRVITANDIAVRAIESKQVQPWPDGAAFAKIAWKQVADEKGIVHADQFLQVEFMVKDQHRYAATAGWGWGRWKGMDLKPYGKDANFTAECVSCHQPVKKNDFVYTQPLARNAQVHP
jgi:mono/diheme cytochrome c family protein